MQITSGFIARHFLLLIIAFSLSSCGIFGPQEINLSTQHQEEAKVYFISMDENRSASIAEVMQDSVIRADIWVEPTDPEIGTFEDSFANREHIGQTTNVAIVQEKPFKELKRLPKTVNWRPYINQATIQEGLVFIVRSSSDIYYKTKIKSFNDQRMTIIYKEL